MIVSTPPFISEKLGDDYDDKPDILICLQNVEELTAENVRKDRIGHKRRYEDTENSY